MCSISVIIPCYHVEKFIRRCLNSVICQTFSDWEIIVIDDCGQDQSMKIVQDIASGEPRIKIIANQKNSGQGASRDAGVAAAAGKYILMLDSDDWIAPKTLQKCYDTAEKAQADMVVFSVKHHYRFSSRIYPQLQTNNIVYTGKQLIEKYLTIVGHDTAPNVERYEWNKFIKRDMIKDHHLSHLPKRLLGEDFYFCGQLLFYAQRIVCLSDVLYHYERRNARSLTAAKNIDLFLTMTTTWSELKNFFINQNYWNAQFQKAFWSGWHRQLFFELMHRISLCDDVFNRNLLLRLSCQIKQLKLYTEAENPRYESLQKLFLQENITTKQLWSIKIQKLKIVYIPLWVYQLKQKLLKD